MLVTNNSAHIVAFTHIIACSSLLLLAPVPHYASHARIGPGPRAQREQRNWTTCPSSRCKLRLASNDTHMFHVCRSSHNTEVSSASLTHAANDCPKPQVTKLGRQSITTRIILMLNFKHCLNYEKQKVLDYD